MDAKTHTHAHAHIFCDPLVAQSTVSCPSSFLSLFLCLFPFFLSLSRSHLCHLYTLSFLFCPFPPRACFSTFRLAIALSHTQIFSCSLPFFLFLYFFTYCSLSLFFPLFLSLSLCSLCSFVWHYVSISALSLPLCLTFPFSLPPCPFLGYQTIFPAMRLVTPPPFCPLPPSPASSSCSSCGRAPIREMITLRHSNLAEEGCSSTHTH